MTVEELITNITEILINSTNQTNEIEHPHLSPSEAVILIIFMASLSLSGTVLNLLVIIVYRKKRTQYASLYLLFVLALVDLIVSSLVVPFTLLTYFQLFRKADLLCGFAYFSRYSTSSLSVCLLGLIAVERYHTITTRTILPLTTIQLTFVRNSKIATITVTIICLSYAMGCFFIFQNVDDTKGCGERDPLNSTIYNIVGISVLVFILVGLIVLYIKTYIIVKQSRNRVFITNTTANKEVNIENTPSNFNSIKTKAVSLNASRTIIRQQKQQQQQQDQCESNIETVTRTNSPNKIVVSTIERISSLLKVNEALMNRPELESTSITNAAARNNLIFKFISSSYLNETTNNLPLNVYEYQTESIEIPSTVPARTRSMNSKHIACLNENKSILPTSSANLDQNKISKFDSYSPFIDSKTIQIDSTHNKAVIAADDTITKKLSNFYSKIFTKQQHEPDDRINENRVNVMSINVLPQESISAAAVTTPFRRRASRKQSIKYNNPNVSIRKDWRIARMFALVTVVFVITWIPWCLITLKFINYNIIIINTYFLNNAINPIIYSFLSKSFRKEAKLTFISLFQGFKVIKKKAKIC